jgi:peptidyl-prolyl cis-trans isomerase B (cyclophilin B)
MSKKILCIILLIAFFAGCGQQNQAVSGTQDVEDTPNADPSETINATIVMENGDVIELELYPQIAPQSVYNFAFLAREGFYDGLIFHRVIKNFMIQGGDPQGTGGGGPGYTIKGEFKLNGFENTLSHKRGVLSMARRGDPAYNSGGSQFFIMHKDNTGLDGSYAAFGKVTAGMDIVDKIAESPTGQNDRPLEEIKIKTISIDGPELPEPERLRN